MMTPSCGSPVGKGEMGKEWRARKVERVSGSLLMKDWMEVMVLLTAEMLRWIVGLVGDVSDIHRGYAHLHWTLQDVEGTVM
jgi:hypothetical protein